MTRSDLVARLADLGLVPAAPPHAPYVLVEVPDGWRMKTELRRRGFAVRSCANFVGLGADHLRLAVRPPEITDRLISAMQDVAMKDSGAGAAADTDVEDTTGWESRNR